MGKDAQQIENSPDFVVGGGPHSKVPFNSPGYLICGVGACVLAFAYLFLVLTPALESDALNQTFIQRLSFLIACCIAQCAMYFNVERASTKKGVNVLATAGMLLMTVITIPSFMEVPFSMSIVCWMCSGIGFACISPLNLKFLSSLHHNVLIITTAAMFTLAAALACLVSYTEPVMFRLIMLIIIAVSTGCLVLYSNTVVDYAWFRVSMVDTRMRMHLSWKSAGAVVNHSMFLGFSIYLINQLVHLGHFWVILIVVSVIVFVAISTAAEEALGSGRFLDEGVQLRFTLPLAMIGIAPVMLFGESGMLFSACLILLAFIPQEMTNIDAVVESIRFDHLNVIYTYSMSRVMNVVGLGVGYLLGFVANGGIVPQSLNSFVVISFFMLFVAAVMSSAFFKNRYPRTTTLFEDSNLPLSSEGETPAVHPMSWKKRCDAFSESIGLSPRQHDVFILLARGHNASYIERTLVISNHTVKSHTYSIYQKAHVHSKQELIECVEQFEPDRKKY